MYGGSAVAQGRDLAVAAAWPSSEILAETSQDVAGTGEIVAQRSLMV